MSLKRLAAFLLFILALGIVLGALRGDPARILVYGDSNSWGWRPNAEAEARRLPAAERWPSVMDDALGQDYEVVVDAMNGRTTNVDYAEGWGSHSGEDFNGQRGLPAAIEGAVPIDLVIIFLGANDLKPEFDRTPQEIAAGAMELATLAAEQSEAEVLVVVPPALGDISGTPMADGFAGAEAKSRRLPAAFAQAADATGIPLFTDAAPIDSLDGIHMTAQAHTRVGEAIADRVREVLPAAD
ncbi:GDSL-type esterase/lipase family protein [Inquilinus sp. CAU 1745]|uniref:GDSL-type esterase/lipase family protein n=1 Tax=Inquilinus sp. CAU 1745 TaxID=3140369 RepID=UPI00325AD077